MPVSTPKLPKSFSVGNLLYSIEQDDDALDAIAAELYKEPSSVRGATTSNDQTINLRSEGTYGKDVQLEVLTHELVHCFFNDIGVYDVDEDFVNDMGKVLLRFIRDNPKLVAYLGSR